MEVFLMVTIILYGILVVLQKRGLVRVSRIKVDYHHEPAISIIVPARNEETHLEECLRSLSEIEYPKDKLQVIIVNDSSVDRTVEIAQHMVRTHPCMELITTRQGEGNLQGKSNALSAGIEIVRGEIL